MNTVFPLIFFLLIIGCSRSSDSLSALDEGQALITIENIKYNANAVMGCQTLADKEFEKISLIINDSVRVEILKEHFIQEKFLWSTNKAQTKEVIFSLQYNYYGGTIYYAADGWLSVTQNNPSNLSGRFDVKMHDCTASCIGCPETYRTIKGEFIVKRE